MPIFAVEELKAVIEHFFVEVFVYDGMERDKSQVWTRHEKNRRTTAPLISHHVQRPSRQINTHTHTDRQTDGRTERAYWTYCAWAPFSGYQSKINTRTHTGQSDLQEMQPSNPHTQSLTQSDMVATAAQPEQPTTIQV